MFAEATERYLQYKRAFNCEADNFVRVPQLLKKYCDPDAEYVFATTWSDNVVGVLMDSPKPGLSASIKCATHQPRSIAPW